MTDKIENGAPVYEHKRKSSNTFDDRKIFWDVDYGNWIISNKSPKHTDDYQEFYESSKFV